MNKILLSTMGAVAIAFGTMGIAPSTAQAGIAVDDDGKFKIGGTVRVRAERDSRTIAATGLRQDRDRVRLRLRLNGTYQADENWSMGFRIATNTNSLNSPHQTLGLLSANDNADFGLDRAYIKYKNSGLSVWGGKNALNFWEQTEVFWDEDIQPEGFAATYKWKPFTFNAGYFFITDGAWQPAGTDVAITTFQVVYSDEILDDIKFSLGVGGAAILDAPATMFNSDNGYTVGGQLKGSNWRIGGEFFGGNSSNKIDETGFTLQARYKIGGGFGIRAYYYDIGANSLPGDGIFTQDNFPSGNANATNFTGQRYQIDYKVAKNVSADLRYYTMDRKTTGLTNAPLFPVAGNVMSKRSKWDRVQFNLNVKF